MRTFFFFVFGQFRINVMSDLVYLENRKDLQCHIRGHERMLSKNNRHMRSLAALGSRLPMTLAAPPPFRIRFEMNF